MGIEEEDIDLDETNITIENTIQQTLTFQDLSFDDVDNIDYDNILQIIATQLGIDTNSIFLNGITEGSIVMDYTYVSDSQDNKTEFDNLDEYGSITASDNVVLETNFKVDYSLEVFTRDEDTVEAINYYLEQESKATTTSEINLELYISEYFIYSFVNNKTDNLLIETKTIIFRKMYFIIMERMGLLLQKQNIIINLF